ncbi:YppE family protein [Caldibacillus lycopersici]|uniref:YppE family protein n=1 Tax=Perspicuibacillus lycopersici TaxID=1325689 RepID=A0AAE3IS81_9BACI|nr:YppE family protein [Perspicuibacillus lycopersici]MCU9613673.1 YppE family protein [Perspicuibacillus lycopersici]
MKIEELIIGTEKMKDYLTKTDEIYESVRETKEEADFYSTIKPFVDEIHEYSEQWCEQASNWVKENKPRNIYPQQLDAAKENLREICVQAFFPKTSYSRFKHNVHSINYTLEKLLTEIRKKEK